MATTLISSKKSSYGSPYAYYTITAEETARSSSAVTIKFVAKGRLATSVSSLGTGLVLKAGVYIGGAWKTWTLKSSGAVWSGTSWHSATASFSISAGANVTSLSGIKVRVLRTDSYGNGAELKSTTASTSSISIANSATYSVNYNANGGTLPSGFVNPQSKTYGATLKLNSGVPTKASETEDDSTVINYYFGGWNGNDGKIYQPGGEYSTNKPLTLTAIWNTEEKYTVSYDCGEYSSTEIWPESVAKGASLTLSSVKPEATGFVFKNWLGNNGTTYSSGQTITVNQNLSLTAQYTENSHSVQFNLQGGTVSPAMGTLTVKTTVSAYIPEQEPEKSGHEFRYWSTKADGTGLKFYPGGQINCLQNGGTVTLYAIYGSIDIKLYKNGKISCTNFYENSSNNTQVDSSGAFFGKYFTEGKTLFISSSSIECAELIED
jgi:uncharacterized repeat protein (TIGR02543 family)